MLLFKKHASPASLIAQLVKDLPAMQETLVQFLGWEEPLEKGMATHSSILVWRIPWDFPGNSPGVDCHLKKFSSVQSLIHV